ncbi:MAG: ribulose-phosphate 3-epimerase, ribulose-phosphate 3-epimerase [Parcubacteria group bacterium]|nr:ribulose-phosphate 3-epimerase, ribulose-phosphate 3-epimerase [Parcubacteria group bacterium]
MSIIIPAILPTSREDLNEKLLQLQGIATDVQIDTVDGRFVRPASWPYVSHANVDPVSQVDEEAFSYAGSITCEMDLMVERPEAIIGQFIHAGASRITVHAETSHNLSKLISDFQTVYGHDKNFVLDLLSFGLAINIATDTALIEPFLDRIDYVQFMGIASIGKQGEPFDRSVLPKIAKFRRKYPNVPIQVDGGVSLATAPDLLSAGVSRLVVGSALWKAPNLAEAYAAFTQLTQTYGIYE